jgi:chorismate mutase/prephenate dehydrogenase
MTLATIRGKIDKIDNELIKVISKRIALIPAIAKIKKESNLPRINQKREAEIIARLRNEAKSLSLSPSLAEKVIRILIKESHKIEKRIMKK